MMKSYYITVIYILLIDNILAAQLFDLWSDYDPQDGQLGISDLDYKELEEAVLGYRVDETDGGEGCGNFCKASLLTLAGFGSLAVYNGLEKESVAGKLTRRMDSAKNDAQDTLQKLSRRVGEAWKKSEALAARREMQEAREKLAEERFTAQKRREFLSLIRNGLRDWRSQNAKKIDRSDEEKKESFGTQLGRRVRYALEFARRQEELRQQKPNNRADQGQRQGLRHPATDIINSLNPITWWVNYLSKDKPRRSDEKSMRKRFKKNRARAGELRRRPMVNPKGKVTDD